MNDKTEQALTDELIDQIESAARASFRRHQSSIKGQLLTAADNYDWHLLHAAYQAGIQTMRAQLAEARRDVERWRWLRDHARIFRQSPDMSGNHYWMVHATTTLRGPTLDAAIDAAKGKTS